MSNENESGKEIWKEYLDNALYGRKTKEEYLYFGKTLDKQDCWLNGVFVPKNFERFKRAPKTQIINGHEVVAPRYDSITNCTNDEICVFSSSEEDGVCQLNINIDNTSYCSSFGWFDSYGVCLAYANAHREDK